MAEPTSGRDRIRALIFYGLLLVVVFVVVQNLQQGRELERLTKQIVAQNDIIESQGKDLKSLLENRTQLFNVLIQNQEEIRALAQDAKAAAMNTERSAENTETVVNFLNSPERQQTVARAIAEIQRRLDAMLEAIKALQFRVEGTVGNNQFQGTARPVAPSPDPSCRAAIGVGNVEVAPGVASICP